MRQAGVSPQRHPPSLRKHVARRVIPPVLAIAVLAGTAAAQSPLATGAGANYRVAVTSWSEIPFRSVVRQRYDFSCGSAAVATLLSFHYGRATPEQPVFGAMWAVGDQPTIRRSGFSMLDIKRYLDGRGLTTEGFRLSLDQMRRLNRPGIVILNLAGYRHFVVVKGMSDAEILVGDPMLGLTRYRVADFRSRWNGIFLTVMAGAAGRQPPRFNLASDWGPWARASLGGGEPSPAIAHLTTYLPPLYQITPAVLSMTRPATGR